jgi:hypothetical protein
MPPIPFPIKHVQGNIWGGRRMRYDIWTAEPFLEAILSKIRQQRTSRKLLSSKRSAGHMSSWKGTRPKEMGGEE